MCVCFVLFLFFVFVFVFVLFCFVLFCFFFFFFFIVYFFSPFIFSNGYKKKKIKSYKHSYRSWLLALVRPVQTVDTSLHIHYASSFVLFFICCNSRNCARGRAFRLWMALAPWLCDLRVMRHWRFSDECLGRGVHGPNRCRRRVNIG